MRGAVVPVADIRIRFGMEATVNTKNTCIIVVEVEASGEDEAISVGVLADQVLEVADIATADIQSHPEMGTGVPPRYLRGLGKIGESFFMILDVEEIIREDMDGSATFMGRETED